MASRRIKDLTALASGLLSVDRFIVDTVTPDATKSVRLSVILQGLGLRVVTVATLPSGVAGTFVFVTDGRKVGEGSGNGTGVLCSWNGTNWITFDQGSAVAA